MAVFIFWFWYIIIGLIYGKYQMNSLTKSDMEMIDRNLEGIKRPSKETIVAIAVGCIVIFWPCYVVKHIIRKVGKKHGK